MEGYDGFLIHKMLTITDRVNRPFTFDDMPDEVKQKISSFISIQKSCLYSFLSNRSS